MQAAGGKRTIRVLVVDDSATARAALQQILATDEQFLVVGVAEDGSEAVQMVPATRPDVVIMDIHMRDMDGFEATRLIMEQNPVPIVILSTLVSPDRMENTFRALDAGAVAALEKLKGPGHPDFPRTAAKLLTTIKLMSEVKVVRRSRQTGKAPVPAAQEKSLVTPSGGDAEALLRGRETKLVAMGASTGGPPVLREILSSLPANFPVPIVVVQHITPGFLDGMVQWLSRECSLAVRIAGHGEAAEAGTVYFAPDGRHLGIDKNGRLVLSDAPPVNGLKPSVSWFFFSFFEAYGPRSTGVLLTGMGKDGSLELKELKDRGAVTIAQDKESSVVHGMPGYAICMGGASLVCSPGEIAEFLLAQARGGGRRLPYPSSRTG
ncbi:MAG: chemotaxis-specific protein-glutamate methyltransferase CheB [Deltaproteobacteria bacterium]|nr:chemotaxis-specific protein-glutamate methyltransferase CheB [Deltaproteobacteria bacterium]